MTLLAIDGSFTLHRAKNVVKEYVRSRSKKMIEEGSDEQTIENYIQTNVNQTAMISIFFKIIPPKMEEFYPSRVYVLWDFGRCKYRHALNENYKNARTIENPTLIDVLVEKAYAAARSYLHVNLPRIGIASLLVPGVEADDLAYYLSHTHANGVLLSDDKDWFLNLNEGWQLCRPMQTDENKNKKDTYLYDWGKFTTLMQCDNTQTSPRAVYLLEKAFMGDKDEIPRITTPAVAKRLARHVIGFDVKLKLGDKEILEKSQNQLNCNIQLADTSWLVTNPQLADMSKILNTANASVTVGNSMNFLDFASNANAFGYTSRWSNVCKQLNYREIDG